MLDRKRKKIPMKTEDPRLACVCRSVSPLRLNRISDELINGEGILAGVKEKKKKKDMRLREEEKKEKLRKPAVVAKYTQIVRSDDYSI